MLQSGREHNVTVRMVFELGKGMRMAPLAAALALLHAGGAVANVRDVAMPAVREPGTHPGAAALFRALRDAYVRGPVPVHVPVVIPVASCADDGGPDTLRSAFVAAGDGDTLDMSGLTCSVITLAQGAIPAFPDHLTLRGPGASRLAIDGAGLDRVFVHYGYYSLRIENQSVRNGFNQVSGYHVAGGACVLSNGYVTLDHSTVSGCRSIGEGAYGGGILARGITMYASKLADNLAQGSLLSTLTASYGAGAFAYWGTAALYDSMVSGNRATIDPANTYGSYDTGAGIFSDNGGIAVRSTIAGNYTDGTGGGIASHASFIISNSTLSGNVALRKNGGGVFLRLNGSLAVNNSTITDNQAVDGGGIYIAGSAISVDLQSTIIAGNRASAGAADVSAKSGLIFSGANNLVISSAAGIVLPADTLHTDPLLLPLADNGGPTFTHALARGSPALDTGNNAANLDSDQRGAGHPRIIGANADIGAYEASLAATAPAAAVSALPNWALGLLSGLLIWFVRRRLT